MSAAYSPPPAPPRASRPFSFVSAVALLAVMALVVSSPAPVQAQDADADAPTAKDDEAARDHFEAGRAYFERARYEDAAREFDEAFRLSGRPELLVNVSRSREAHGENQRAADALRRYLELRPDDPQRAAYETRLQRLELAAERDAEAEGQAVDAAHASTDPAVEDPLAPKMVGAGLSGAGTDDGLTGLQWGGVAALAIGGVSVIVALVTGLSANSTYADLEDACDADGGCPAQRADDIDSGASMATASTIFTAVGVVGLGAGLTLLLLGGDEESNRSEKSLSLTSGPGLVGAGMNVRF